jgi:hypothetical protein
LRECVARYGPDLIVQGDRDVNTTACCGDHLYNAIPELWAEALGDDMTLDDLVLALGPNARRTGQLIEIQLRDGNWYPWGDVIRYTHQEAQDGTSGGGPLTINLTGTAT